MSFEASDDGAFNEQWPLGGDFGVEETSLGEYDPTGGILPSDGAPASPDLLDVSAPSHGVARFEGMEPQFDGRPPDEYLEATYWKLDGAIQRGYHTKHKRLFADSERSVYVTEEQDGSLGKETEVRRITALEYRTPEGLAEIQLSYRELKVRFKDNDGNVLSYCRYYTDYDSYGEGEEPYEVTRKDTVDLEAEGFVATEGLSRSDANILRNEADYQHRKAIHDRKQQGVENPLVSVEEADYVFGEVLANARPVRKTHEEVIAAIEEQIMHQRPSEQPGTAVEKRQTDVGTFEKLLDAYREHVLSSGEAASWDKKTTRETVSEDGKTKTVRTTGAIPENPIMGEVDYITVDTIETLDRENLLRRMGEMDMYAVVTENGGTIITSIRLMNGNQYQLAGDITVDINVEGMGDIKRTPQAFIPTEQVMRVVRNYLWDDVNKADSTQV